MIEVRPDINPLPLERIGNGQNLLSGSVANLVNLKSIKDLNLQVIKNIKAKNLKRPSIKKTDYFIKNLKSQIKPKVLIYQQN